MSRSIAFCPPGTAVDVQFATQTLEVGERVRTTRPVIGTDPEFHWIATGEVGKVVVVHRNGTAVIQFRVGHHIRLHQVLPKTV
eukprot:gene30204-5056_t